MNQDSLLYILTQFILILKRNTKEYRSKSNFLILVWTFSCLYPTLALCLLPTLTLLPLGQTSFETFQTELSSLKITTFNRRLWLGWWLGLIWIRTDTTVWLAGLLLLTSQVESWQLILSRPVIKKKKVILSPPLDRFYRFRLVEHERWWFHKGWVPIFLPNDRPHWSDEYLVQVPSIHDFKLPPAIIKKGQEISWEWVTEWQAEKIEGDGWEYGSWDWENWSDRSKGLFQLTRRRFWIRNAHQIKRNLKSYPIPIRPSRSTTSSLSTSLSSFDEEFCTTPHSSPLLYRNLIKQ